MPRITAARLFYFALPALLLWDSDGRAAAAPIVGERPAASYSLGLAGDSTVAQGPPGGPVHGWGEFLADGLGPRIRLLNFAKGGESSGSFIENGIWERALGVPLDAVIIQFGHNDFFRNVPVATYADNLRSYIKTARARQTFPILVTPVQRLKFKDGKHLLALTEYANATRRVARETTTPYIDLNLLSETLFERLGPAGVAQISSGVEESDHFNALGARAIAQLVLRELRRQPTPIRELLPELTPGKPLPP